MHTEEASIMDNRKDNITAEEVPSAAKKTDDSAPERTFKREKIEMNDNIFENSTVFCPAEEKFKKKSKLTPIKKGIISISSLAIVTAVVLVLVMFVIPKDDDSTESEIFSSASTEISVMTVSEDKIKSVKVTNQNDSFVIIPKAIEDDEGAVTYEWLVKGYEHIDFSTPEYMVDAVTEITAIKAFDIEESAFESAESNSGEETDSYGFSQPYADISVVLADDSEYCVTVGNISPDKSGRYIAISGEGEYSEYEGKAYLISTSTIDCVGNALNDCVNLISAPAFVSTGDDDPYYTDGELTSFDKLLIGGKLHKDTIKVVCPSDDLSLLSYMVEEPSSQAANDESVNEILTLTTGVYNSGAYVLDYKKSDLKKYGLDKPYVTYYIQAGDRIIDMKISKADEDGYYAYIVSYSTDGGKTFVDNNIIYKLNSSGNEYIEYTSEEIYFEKLFIEYVKYVESMTVTVSGGPSHTFTLDHEEGNEASFTVTTEKGKKIDKDEFCYYYARLLYLSALENEDVSYKTVSDYVIKFNITYTEEGKNADEIIIYPYESNVRRYIYKLNGKGTSLVSRSLVDDIIDCLDPLANGKEIGNKYAN